MNTILASGIVSFGKELITNLTTPKPVLKSSQSVSFNDEFENVQNAKNTKSLSQINQEFVSREDISEFLRSEQGNQVLLEKRADNSLQLISSSGRSLIIPNGTESCTIGHQLLDQSLLEEKHIARDRLNAIIIQH